MNATNEYPAELEIDAEMEAAEAAQWARMFADAERNRYAESGAEFDAAAWAAENDAAARDPWAGE